jgi:hypothetical protein
MAGPVYVLRLILVAALLGPVIQAEPAAPAAPAMTEPTASPKFMKLFAGIPPKYDSPKPGATAPRPAPTSDQPRNSIIRLPTYIVRETRPISDDEVLTQNGREHAMAMRYLGPQNSLDLALNAVTLTDLWKSIPVLGRIPFVPFDSMSYSQRAAKIYELPERKRQLNELLSIEQFARDAENPKPADKPTK